MNISELETDLLKEQITKKIRHMRKTSLIAVATYLNGGRNRLERFEQISRPVTFEQLTVQQLQRYITKQVDQLDDRVKILAIGKMTVGPIIKGNVEQCCVCLELMGSQKNSLSCGHWVHYGCMVKSASRNCPMCRRDVGEDLPWHILHDIKQKKDWQTLTQRLGL